MILIIKSAWRTVSVHAPSIVATPERNRSRRRAGRVAGVVCPEIADVFTIRSTVDASANAAYDGRER